MAGNRAWGRSRMVDVGGFRVHCRIAGRGRPLVLLHGFPQNLHEWRHVAPHFTDGRRVIAIDQRGFGGTDRPYPPRISRAILVRDLCATLDALGVAGADVVGHDWGGHIAFSFAARHPDRVRKLVLVDTVLTRVVLKAVPHFLWFKVRGLAEGALDPNYVRGAIAALCRTPGAFEDADLQTYAGAFRHPGTRAIAISAYRHALGLHRVVRTASGGERFERLTLGDCQRRWEQGASDAAAWDGEFDVAPSDRHVRLRQPALWVYATGLGRPNTAFRRQFTETFSDLQTLELDCGHWIPEEWPDALSEAMASFLD